MPHWECYINRKQTEDFKVVVPSYDRPTEVVDNTLTWLRDQGIPLNRIGVFVAPTTVDGQDHPEWFRYLTALRHANMTDVHVVPGGNGLENQMMKCMEWVGEGYMIIMSDTVRHLCQRAPGGGAARLEPVPKGTLTALIKHGADLLRASGCIAWSVNPSHRADNLSPLMITRRLGMLDGNLTGIFLPSGWRELKVTKGHGVIYDVEFSAVLWSHGYRFVRYQGLCCAHTYRLRGGQATLMPNALKRRRLENEALKVAARKYPDQLEFFKKPAASLRNMQYRYKKDGEERLTMVRQLVFGRPRRYRLGASSTSTDRMRRHRQRASARQKMGESRTSNPVRPSRNRWCRSALARPRLTNTLPLLPAGHVVGLG